MLLIPWSFLCVAGSANVNCGVMHLGLCFRKRIRYDIRLHVPYEENCLSECIGRATCNTWAWISGNCYLMTGVSLSFQQRGIPGRKCTFGIKCGCGVRTTNYTYLQYVQENQVQPEINTKNADSCEEKCYVSPNCVAWSWYPKESIPRPKWNCYLFNEIQGTYGKSDNFAVSSRKCNCGVMHNSTCSSYRPQESIAVYALYATECRGYCIQIASCVIWVWNSTVCYLSKAMSLAFHEPGLRGQACTVGFKCAIGAAKTVGTSTTTTVLRTSEVERSATEREKVERSATEREKVETPATEREKVEAHRNVAVFLFVNITLHNNTTEDGLCIRDHPLFVSYEEALLHLLNSTGGLKDIVVVNVQYSLLNQQMLGEDDQFLNNRRLSQISEGGQLLWGIEYSLKLSSRAERQLEDICRDDADKLNEFLVDIPRFGTVHSTEITTSQEKFESQYVSQIGASPGTQNCSDATVGQLRTNEYETSVGQLRTNGWWICALVTLAVFFVGVTSFYLWYNITCEAHRPFAPMGTAVVGRSPPIVKQSSLRSNRFVPAK